MEKHYYRNKGGVYDSWTDRFANCNTLSEARGLLKQITSENSRGQGKSAIITGLVSTLFFGPIGVAIGAGQYGLSRSRLAKKKSQGLDAFGCTWDAKKTAEARAKGWYDSNEQELRKILLFNDRCNNSDFDSVEDRLITIYTLYMMANMYLSNEFNGRWTASCRETARKLVNKQIFVTVKNYKFRDEANRTTEVSDRISWKGLLGELEKFTKNRDGLETIQEVSDEEESDEKENDLDVTKKTNNQIRKTKNKGNPKNKTRS